MKKYKFYIVVISVLIALPCTAQNDSITYLDEVIISDIKIEKFSEGYKVRKIVDSTIRNNDASLTSLLRYNSTIYFRENGVGGTSSASFRGTSASQTAVIWNGININSQLNGQTDFNTVAVNNYDNISVRSGGGSVQYGSGAIAGSVHLNNDFEFKDHFSNKLRMSYGSFNTGKTVYKVRYGSKKVYSDLGVDYVNSDNDYKYLGTDFRNQNGEFRNLNLNANIGFFIAKDHLLKIYHNTYLGKRNFSGLLSGSIVSPSNDGYRDINSRSLLTWKYNNSIYTSTLSIAHLHEFYRYFDNIRSDEFDFGKSNNALIKYDFLYAFGKDIEVNLIADYSFIQGKGTNFGGETDRNIFSGVVLYKHTISEQLNYGIQLRQEVSDAYDSPLLGAIDLKYTPFKNYSIKFNASKNYRIPTYNDLFWVGPGGLGNRNLKPETSLQAEIGQEIKLSNISFSLHAYYIKAKDLIQWKPINSGVWSPTNIKRVESYGIETGMTIYKKWLNHEVVFRNDYAYTISEDRENGNQLIYVPFHKTTSALSYNYKRMSVFYQFLYNGSVFITTDNTRDLDMYDVSNIGLIFTYFKSSNKQYTVDFKINNIYNNKYQNVGFRPMPNRNYQLQLTFKY